MRKHYPELLMLRYELVKAKLNVEDKFCPECGKKLFLNEFSVAYDGVIIAKDRTPLYSILCPTIGCKYKELYKKDSLERVDINGQDIVRRETSIG